MNLESSALSYQTAFHSHTCSCGKTQHMFVQMHHSELQPTSKGHWFCTIAHDTVSIRDAGLLVNKMAIMTGRLVTHAPSTQQFVKASARAAKGPIYHWRRAYQITNTTLAGAGFKRALHAKLPFASDRQSSWKLDQQSIRSTACQMESGPVAAEVYGNDAMGFM